MAENKLIRSELTVKCAELQNELLRLQIENGRLVLRVVELEKELLTRRVAEIKNGRLALRVAELENELLTRRVSELENANVPKNVLH